MQWALGIMMYQMLSGHLPFWNAQSDRSPFAVMSAILSAEVRHLSPVSFWQRSISACSCGVVNEC